MVNPQTQKMKTTKILPLRQINRTRKKHRNHPWGNHEGDSVLSKCERIPLLPIPLEISARVLSDPKQKLSARSRKRFLKSRGAVIDLPCTEPVLTPIKFARRLTRLSLRQVGREIHKAAHRAATAKYILDDLSPDSMFRPSVQAQHDAQLHRFKQAVAEREARINSK